MLGCGVTGQALSTRVTPKDYWNFEGPPTISLQPRPGHPGRQGSGLVGDSPRLNMMQLPVLVCHSIRRVQLATDIQIPAWLGRQ